VKTVALALIAMLTTGALAQAQQPPPQPPPPAPPPTSTVPVPDATVPATPSVIPVGTRVGLGLLLSTGYDSDGRRDPFLSLVMPKRLAAGAMDSIGGRPRSGLAGVPVADIVLRGITRAGTRMLAILEAPNKQSYVAKPQDKLLDASIKSIDANGVVFVDEGGGEIRKTLRPMGEVIR
jgi:hypothetical protein